MYLYVYGYVLLAVIRKVKKIAFQIQCVCTQLTIRRRKKNKQTTGTREKKRKKGWRGAADRLYSICKCSECVEPGNIHFFFCPQ